MPSREQPLLELGDQKQGVAGNDFRMIVRLESRWNSAIENPEVPRYHKVVDGRLGFRGLADSPILLLPQVSF